MQVQIHTARIGKPVRVFQEELIELTEFRLKTFVPLPVEISEPLSKDWQRMELLRPADWISSITKYYFFNDYLGILAFHDVAERLLGYYCDIVTPLQKVGDDYHRTDLVLDLCITLGLDLYELDWDEYEEVIDQGLMTVEQQELARSTLVRLKAEVASGLFPTKYIR